MVMVFIFLFGLAVGSFLNALIWRLQTGESIFRGRSYCPKCKHALGAKDLIPVLSFMIQRGRCRYCGKAISWQYPLVELATAVLFAAAYSISDFRFSISDQFFSFSVLQFFSLLRMWFVIAVMIIVFIYDLKYTLILDKVIYPAAVVVLLLHSISAVIQAWGGLVGLDHARDGVLHSISAVILAAAIGGGFFLLQYLFSKGKWIGGGDIKMGFLMGLILGVKGLLVALFFSYVFGALVGVGLIVAGKKTIKSQIPFGTFLAVGTIVALFWGEEILRWYLK